VAIVAIEGAGAHKVIVLHGWALDSGVWLGARALSDVTRFTFAFVDFPGYGVDQAGPVADGIDGMAKVALDAADELGWQRFSILGHSMGGATALRVATLAPQRVLSIAAVTPVSPAGTALDEQTYATFVAAWSDPGAAIKVALAPEIDDADLGRLVARNRASMTDKTWEAYLANWTGPDFLDAVRALPTPVTLLYGESDPFVTRAYLADLADALTNGRTEEIPGAGHYPMIEAPAAAVARWEAALARA
jgi:pimeloyl-ACP methyl ester carboxylesterase